MEDSLNTTKTYTDVGFTICGASNDELRNALEKYNQEAAVRIELDGEISFDTLDESKRPRIKKGEMGYNSPHVNGFSITFQDGDQVTTKDGREGIVLESNWFPGNVLYRYNDEPRMGYYYIKVDFDDHIEYHLRNDLSGPRFRKL